MKCKNCGHNEMYHEHDTNRCPAYWLGGIWADTTFEVSAESENESEKLSKVVTGLLLRIDDLEKRIVHLENDLAAREYHEELKQSMADRVKDRSY